MPEQSQIPHHTLEIYYDCNRRVKPASDVPVVISELLWLAMPQKWKFQLHCLEDSFLYLNNPFFIFYREKHCPFYIWFEFARFFYFLPTNLLEKWEFNTCSNKYYPIQGAIEIFHKTMSFKNHENPFLWS